MGGRKKLIQVDLVDESTHPDAIETFALIKTKSRIGNIHRTMANSPTVFKNFIGMSYALRYTTLLNPLERELAICCVLERHQSDYELSAHRPFALALGATEEQVMNIRNPDKRGLYSDRQRAILRFAERLAADPSERDSLESDAIEDYLDNRERIELGMTLGIYMGMAHFTALFNVPMESEGMDPASLRRAAQAGK